MIAVLMAAGRAFATAPLVLATLLEGVFLLAFRAWAATTDSIHSRAVTLLLDGMIAVVVITFVIIVTVRFASLA